MFRNPLKGLIKSFIPSRFIKSYRSIFGSTNYKISLHNQKVIDKLRDQKVIELSVLPPPESPLSFINSKGIPQPISFFPDDYIGKNILFYHSGNDPSLLLSITELAEKLSLKEVTLFDVGANIGLFSRQLKKSLGSRLQNINAFEPHPENFRLLSKNLESIHGVSLHNFGLSYKDEIIKLNIDSRNTGNYSFVESAIKKHQFGGYEEASVRNVYKVMEELCKDLPGPFIYKSDTQGFDQLIACSIPTWFWEKVSIAVFELWRLPLSNSNSYNTESFEKIISRFSNLRFKRNFDVPVSVKDVVKFLSYSDYKHDDLIAWGVHPVSNS